MSQIRERIQTYVQCPNCNGEQFVKAKRGDPMICQFCHVTIYLDGQMFYKNYIKQDVPILETQHIPIMQ